MAAARSTLVLVPTELERRLLARQPGFGSDARTELCGFGPVTAAARTAELLARFSPTRVLLVGIAGTFDPEALPIGTATTFGRVMMHGIGVGSGPAFVPAGAMGFPHWNDPDAHVRVDDQLELASPVPPADGALLTACAASISAEDAGHRMNQCPGAIAEDMEGFAVALSARLAKVPVAIVRGISNHVGDRKVDGWQIGDALDAAWTVASDLVTHTDWSA